MNQQSRLKLLVITALVLVLFTTGLSVGCAPTSDELPAEGNYTIGLLLPFTGSAAGTAANFERAVLLAADRVNDSGGINGRRLRIVARDSHSELKRSLKSVEELIDEGALAVIGPESPEIAAQIKPKLDEADVFLLSPVVGEGEEQDIDCDFPWYRMSPSAKSLGENLAKDVSREGYTKVAVMYGEGDYNRAFRAAFVNKFAGVILGGEVLVEQSLKEDASSYADKIKEVLRQNPELIVLSASAKTGALVVNEAGFLGADNVRWGLSPLLKTPLFLQNVETRFVEGALGVAPKIFERSQTYSEEFQSRWQGDDPLEGAYFFHDAVGLLTVSLAILDLKKDQTPEYADLQDAISQAASTRGEAVGWSELDQVAGIVKNGVDVNYAGLTGPMVMQPCGDRRSGITRSWTIRDGSIVDILDASEE